MHSQSKLYVEGRQIAESEIVNGKPVENGKARKFVRDGMIYIEHDGVIYNAQGQKTD